MTTAPLWPVDVPGPSALRLGAQVTLITARADVSLAQHASHLLVIPAPTPKSDPEIGVSSLQPMSNLFEQSLHLLLDAITMELIGRFKFNAAQMFKRHANLE